MVRISDSWEKSTPGKDFEILFWFETSKNDHSRGGGRLLVPLPFYFPKMPFYSQNCSFIFQNCSFIFQNRPFVSFNRPFIFQKCPFVLKKFLFILQKCLIVFQNYHLVFQKCLFLFTIHVFFQECFFPADFTFSSTCSELLREIIFALLLFCFPLETFIDQLVMPT